MPKEMTKMAKKKKVRKKYGSQKWQRLADDEWSRVIREVGHCEWCGRTDKMLNAHHIINRTNFLYRHLIANGVCLCVDCHRGAQSAHADRTVFYAWLNHNRPGIWSWFMRHTTTDFKVVGNRTVKVYKPIFIPHEGDEAEYELLKEIRK